MADSSVSEDQSEYLLHVEAVNLAAFIDDTHELSTIRGGSLMLLSAVSELHVKIPTLRRIASGASAGLFSFGGDPDAVMNQVRELLREEHPHATFALAFLRASDNFQNDRAKLLAQIRRNQLRQPTVVFPGVTDTQKVCEIDHVRPGVAWDKSTEPGRWLSASVDLRRRFGRSQRQAFYGRWTRDPDDPSDQGWTLPATLNGFTNDLESLSKRVAPLKALSQKMAVIYLDGNGFGKIQEQTIEERGDLERWDDDVQKKRRELLRSFLEKIAIDPHWQTGSAVERRIRLETLLWGGDDICWVVPAWKGWESLRYFFEVSKNWSFEGKDLTHAAGIVFCHHKAPIHTIRHETDLLVRLAKKRTRDQSSFAYLVLESFDHVSGDPEAFWEKRLPKDWNATRGTVLAGEMKRFEDLRLDLRDLPKLRLLQICRHLQAGQIGEAKKVAGRALLRLDGLTPETRDWLTGPGESPMPDAAQAAWVHLAELWDYIPSDPVSTGAGDSHAETQEVTP